MMTRKEQKENGTRDLRLRCRCGVVELHAHNVSPANSARLACACTGCQSFAQRMDPSVRDKHGGTQRIVMNPGNLQFGNGAEHLACLQQTRGGAIRWFAECCQTDLALTLPSPSVPFVGLPAARVLLVDEEDITSAVGPVRARVNYKLAGSQRRALRADLFSLLQLLRHLTPLIWRWWRTRHQHRSPFFKGHPTKRAGPFSYFTSRPGWRAPRPALHPQHPTSRMPEELRARPDPEAA